jgi:hypothetical protein
MPQDAVRQVALDPANMVKADLKIQVKPPPPLVVA